MIITTIIILDLYSACSFTFRRAFDDGLGINVFITHMHHSTVKLH